MPIPTIVNYALSAFVDRYPETIWATHLQEAFDTDSPETVLNLVLEVVQSDLTDLLPEDEELLWLVARKLKEIIGNPTD